MNTAIVTGIVISDVKAVDADIEYKFCRFLFDVTKTITIVL